MQNFRTRRIIDDAGADAVLAAAEAAAREQGSRVVIAIVDPSGELIQLRRTPGAQIASSRVAVDKARTAAIFVRPSRVMEEQVTNGRLGALALHGVSALTGGIPLVVEGQVVGAIGTSGETPDEDEGISLAGAAAEFSTVEVPALTYEGAARAAQAVNDVAAKRGVPAFWGCWRMTRIPCLAGDTCWGVGPERRGPVWGAWCRESTDRRSKALPPSRRGSGASRRRGEQPNPHSFRRE